MGKLIKIGRGEVLHLDTTKYVDRLKGEGLDLVVSQTTTANNGSFKLEIMDEGICIGRYKTAQLKALLIEGGVTLKLPRPMELGEFNERLATQKGLPESVHDLLVQALANADDYLNHRDTMQARMTADVGVSPSQRIDDVLANIEAIKSITGGDISSYVQMKAAARFIQVDGTQANEIYGTDKFSPTGKLCIIGLDDYSTELLIKPTDTGYAGMLISRLNGQTATRAFPDIKQMNSSELGSILAGETERQEARAAISQKTENKTAKKLVNGF